MVSKLLDKVMHVISEDHLLENQANILTVELDLDLPRGYVAKIHEVIISIPFVEFDKSQVDEYALGYEAALVRDPDDTESTRIPVNTVQHDVVTEFKGSINGSMDGADNDHTITFTNRKTQIKFDTLDVITARNMRFNAQTVTQEADIEIQLRVNVYYSLEKISDADLLGVLDIL